MLTNSTILQPSKSTFPSILRRCATVSEALEEYGIKILTVSVRSVDSGCILVSDPVKLNEWAKLNHLLVYLAPVESDWFMYEMRTVAVGLDISAMVDEECYLTLSGQEESWEEKPSADN